jgi:hypothetical protein
MKEIQKDIDIDWKKIDETINEAIERDEPYILFKFMEIEEYRYIQKVAEVRTSEIGKNLNNIIFVCAVGVSFVLGGVMSALPIISDKFIISIISGILLFYVAVPFVQKYDQQYKVYNKIILNTEKKILWMEKESNEISL